MWDPFLRLFGWLGRRGESSPPPPVPQSDPSGLDELVAKHGEAYREVIEQALEEARRLPRFNPANFNFARYVAERVFLHSVGRSQV